MVCRAIAKSFMVHPHLNPLPIMGEEDDILGHRKPYKEKQNYKIPLPQAERHPGASAMCISSRELYQGEAR